MTVTTEWIEVRTKGHTDVVDLTEGLRAAIARGGLSRGTATMFVPGSTASLSTIEFEPGAVRDIGILLEKFAPEKGHYHHHETWGDDNGSYPQIAGQLPGVTIKQLADIRAGNRDNPIMKAFSSRRALGGAQEIADVAGYIASLPMTDYNGQGSRRYLDMGKEIYMRDCADCHGDDGEGDVRKHVPRLQGQHFRYLERQYKWIRNGRRGQGNHRSSGRFQIMSRSRRSQL